MTVSMQQKLAEALLALGCCEIHGSKVWRVFSHDIVVGKRYYLGKGGALRAGDTVNDSAAAYVDKARLLQVWDEFNTPKAIITTEAS